MFKYKKWIVACLLFPLIFLFMYAGTSFAQFSENFKLTRSVVDQGGAASGSSQFKVNDAIGQPVGGGEMLSSLYRVSSGFFPFEFLIPAPIFPETPVSQPIGAEFWVDIVIGSNEEPVSDLFGISFELNYTNTEYIDVVTPHTSNTIPGDFIGSDVVFMATVDEENGKVSFGISRKSGQGGISGFGVVARVKFVSNVSTPGETDVVFTLADVVANNSAMTPISLSPANLTVTLSGMIVWPGDTNNNGYVDQSDILPLGLFWASTGPARPDASIQWIGQSASPWSPENGTYADANGDGFVNQTDVLPIGLNWHKTHGLQAALPDEPLAEDLQKPCSANLKISITEGLTKQNQVCWVDFIAENVTDLFGISFNFMFSPTSYVDSIKVEESSWLGDDILFYAPVDMNDGSVSFGISKKAGQNPVSGSGVVAKIRMKMKDITPIVTELTLHDVVAINNLGNSIPFEVVNHTLTEVELQRFEIPKSFILFQNYPNPFNPETSISYQLPEKVHVKIAVFNLRGQKIRTLENAAQDAGCYTVRWDGCDEIGNKVVSGIYLYQIKSGDFVCTRKMALMK